ncbi:hypothetical protein BCU96_03230 [Vibrio lentus]|uniref:restriction endonuclease subunit S n=1 Tax=Vibrio lentus TaxID=136468 RepID=UPI000C859528|nr:restriction endonuclease subunit S [Vibrio lentus]PMG24486.1 hypothetical protein BCU96_03230 [Vibrio lentus]
MGSDTVTSTLEDMCELIVDCPHSTPKWTDVGVVVLRNQNIRGGVLDLSTPSYTDESGYLSRVKRAVPQAGDIVITREAPMGEVCVIPEGLKCCLGQRQVLLRPKHDVSTEYLFWALQSPYVQHQISWNEGTGTTVSNIRIPVLKALKIPRHGENETILSQPLSNIASKIEINTKINQTLEQMAQTLFKSWFVDFEPVKAKMNGEQPKGMDAATASLFPEKLVESELGLIPEGWEVNQLSDICKNHSQSYNLKSVDEVVFVNTGDVQEGDFLHKNYSPVVGLPGQAKKAIKEDDILYSEIRPKNKRFAYVDFDVSDYVVSTKFMVIQANEKVHPRLLYMILTRQNTIDEFNIIADSRSGTFPQITFKAISNLEFCMAPREIQDAFVSQIMPMIKLQSSLKSENKQLAETRDTLLPKLLSGEIDLENLSVEQAKALAE